MGLIFAIQPDNRASKAPKLLALKSSKKRFSLGVGFLFGAALLATMYLAASPLFQLLWNEGGLFDRGLTVFILSLIAAYPLVAIFCWFYEEVVLIEEQSPGKYRVTAFEKFFSKRWNLRTVENIDASHFAMENWKGSLNVAALDEIEGESPNRYSTKCHWLLKVKLPSLPDGEMILERRAQKDDLLLLMAQIQHFFGKNFQPQS